MKAPIVSRKHIVNHSQFTVASATVLAQTVITSVAVGNVSSAIEVIEGNMVKAVYLERWLLGDDVTQSTFILIVEKVMANQAAPSFTNMTTLDAYPNKKNILYTTQGVVGSNVTNPIPVIRQWIKIPKGKQRFGLNDKLRVVVAAIGANDLVGCGLSIYKSYS